MLRFNQKIETTVWLGFDNNQRSLHEYADTSALPVWIDYMKTVLKNIPESIAPTPPGIVSARIDPKTGLLAPANFQNAMFEVFRKEYAPTTYTHTTNETTAQPAIILQTSADSNSESDNSQDDDNQAPLF